MVVPKFEPSADHRFLCELCGEKIVKYVKFCGWKEQAVDPKSGYATNVINESVDLVHKYYYACSASCGWQGSPEWWNTVHNASEKAKEKKETPKLFDYYRYPFTTRTNRE
jgi:hypothetical protein